jgi:hypothetical protein
MTVEWTDRGLCEDDEERQGGPFLIVVMTLLAVLAGLFLSSGHARPWLGLAAVGACALFFLGSWVWTDRRHRQIDQLSLVLDDDRLRLTRRSPGSVVTTELLASDAADLISCESGGRNRHVHKLQLLARPRELRIEILERLVKIKAAPFGTDLAAIGLESTRIPLSVIVGSWWPTPSRRYSDDRPWRQPDLDRYAAWRGRWSVIEGLVCLGIGAAGFFFVFIASGNPTATWYVMTILVGFSVLCIGYGSWRLFRGLGVILKRNG